MPVAPVLPFVAAGASVVGGIAAADSARKAGNKAADAQIEAAQLGIEEQRRQFDAARELLAPYNSAGQKSLERQQTLLGMNGQEATFNMIKQLLAGVNFNELVQQQEDAMLQNASATGGLRGGNIQASLAQFRPNLLQQILQQQYNNLGGLTSLGQNSAAMTGNAGQQMANSVGNLFNQQGNAQASAYINAGRQQGNMFNSIVTGVGAAANPNAFLSNMFPSSKGI